MKINNINLKIVQATNLYQQGKLTSAQSIIIKLINSKIFNSKIFELNAYIYEKRGMLNEAYLNLERACSFEECAPKAHYYYGVMHLRNKLYDKAIIQFKKSLNINGDFYEGLNDLATAQANLGLYSEAISNYISSLKFRIDSYKVYLKIAKIQLINGNLVDSLDWTNKSLNENPSNAEAFLNKGKVNNLLGKYKEALLSFDKAIEINKNYADVYFHKCKTLNYLNKHNDAIKSIYIALFINSDEDTYWSELGITHLKLEMNKEALDSFEKAIKLNENVSSYWINKSVALLKLNNYFESQYACIKAIDLDISNASAYINLGLTYYKLKNNSKAISNYRKAISIDPEMADGLINIGIILKDKGRYKPALSCFLKAIKINPFHAEAHYSLADLYFLIGEYDKAWLEYEWRWKTANNTSRILESDKPAHSRYNDSGKKLFIWCEQGIGDQILFSSIFLNLKRNSNTTIISADNRLINLFKRSFPLFTFVNKDEELKSIYFEEQISMGSLFGMYRNSSDEFKNIKVPYLVVNTEKFNYLKSLINEDNKLICGISLTSYNKEYSFDKSIPICLFEKYLLNDKIKFVNLQNNKLDNSYSNQGYKNLFSLKDLDLFDDIDSLAALINVCDYVITCCNSIAHIAGALNKPTFLLAPYSIGKLWYWNKNKNNECIIYPSVQIFCQTSNLSWSEAIDGIFSLINEQ
jgi:tetratricopeptide (TPR) repeat protein